MNYQPDEDTTAVQGKNGKNYYEENTEAQRHPNILERVMAEPKKIDATAGLDAASAAAKKLEVEAASPDHGKPAGAGNAMTFHSWDGETEDAHVADHAKDEDKS